MPYQPGGMLTVGFSDKVPDYDAVKDGSAARRHLPSTAPALVVFGYAFGGRTDDEMLLIINGPNGLFIQGTVKLNRNRARVIPPFLMGLSRRIYAAVFSFMAGVMPPIAMLGRSLL